MKTKIRISPLSPSLEETQDGQRVGGCHLHCQLHDHQRYLPLILRQVRVVPCSNRNNTVLKQTVPQ